MRLLKLFVLSCFLGGLFAALGSILGHAFGTRGLYAGGVIGGILGAFAATAVARWRGWIAADRFLPTALGGSTGFLAAAYLAVTHLSSPVVPILSTVLVGTGALLGSRTGARAH